MAVWSSCPSASKMPWTRHARKDRGRIFCTSRPFQRARWVKEKLKTSSLKIQSHPVCKSGILLFLVKEVVLCSSCRMESVTSKGWEKKGILNPSKLGSPVGCGPISLPNFRGPLPTVTGGLLPLLHWQSLLGCGSMNCMLLPLQLRVEDFNCQFALGGL